MLTSNANPNTTTNANAALYSNGNATKASTTDATAQQDRFLKLLVAQLNNQDPMNPMDNAQMTSQMAQINTVTGINQVNETIKSMAAQFTAMQTLQGTTMIGHEVQIAGNVLNVADGVGYGGVELAGSADKVTVQVLSPGGQVLSTEELGAQPAGRLNFNWDASKYTESANPVFKVTASQGKSTVTATALSRGVVQSVSNDGTGMQLSLKGLGNVDYTAVKAIL
jgi:flagellar basal-body rod modification protein FlgD